MTTDRVEKLYDDVFPGIDVWGVDRSLVSIIYEGKTDTVYIEVYDHIGSFVGNWLLPAKELRELLDSKHEDGEEVQMADNREVERLRYVLDVVLREAEAYAMGWRMDWSGFDGRDLLRHQIRPLVEWARAVA